MEFHRIAVRATLALVLGLCVTFALSACDSGTRDEAETPGGEPGAPDGETEAPDGEAEAPGGGTQVSEGEAKVRASDCSACHALDQKLVGPSYVEIAQRYAGEGPAAVAKLVEKIRVGGSGNWGEVPMTPHPQLSDADLTAMVEWILSLKPGESEATNGEETEGEKTEGEKTEGEAGGGLHSYKSADGKTIQTDFAVFTGPDQKQVTDALFHGYLQYNSYCFRCHGGDAVGGELAPDLRKSLEKGMTYQQFLTVTMAGRQEKGMPAWAGFFEEKDIRAIYEYVKARQLGLLPAGRPPSAQD